MPSHSDRAEKLISVAALCLSIELVLFKFLPDIGTAYIQRGTSRLADFTTFESSYLSPGSVNYPRFLGNYLLYWLAKVLSSFSHSIDPRLHPLRIAAGLLTPIYAYVGAHFVLIRNAELAWRDFLVPYGLTVLMGLYVFYPGDMPSMAFLSISLYLLLSGQRAGALAMMLVTGLFRESAFHMVWMSIAWAVCDVNQQMRRRVAWPCAFAAAFVLQYSVIRHFFPGPISSAGGIIWDPRTLFLDKGASSLTTVCSMGLAVLFPLACLIRWRDEPARDWKRAFFLLNCYVFPAWIVFYRMLNGNLSEFRILFPAILPCIYGISSAGGLIQRRNPSL